jgi:ABC-type transport system involved in multi-copper enzyme maturation permease subunit
MTVTTAATKPGRNIFQGLDRKIQALVHNPVTVKELRGRMRGRKAFIILTIHLTVMSGIITLIYFAFASASSNPYGPQPTDAGKAVFGAVVLIQAIMVLFMGPGATAGAISGEKERQTYDILRTTLLTAEEFVSGKLLSALSYVFLLVIASIPLQSIALLLGGVALSELIIAQLLIIVSAVAYALFGLYASSILKSTLAASVATYGTAIFFTLGIPGLLLLTTIFSDAFRSWWAEVILSYILNSLVSLNLPATLIMSEIILLEENSLWGFSESAGGFTYYIFSPWYINLFIFSLLAFIIYKLTVRRVRRIPS